MISVVARIAFTTMLLAACQGAGRDQDVPGSDQAIQGPPPLPQSRAAAINPPASGAIRFEFTYPQSGVSGYVDYDITTGHCRYYDNWEGGRRGSVSCDLVGDDLKLDGFPYPASDGRRPGAMYFVTLNGLSLGEHCFSELSYRWQETRVLSGKANPIGASNCG